MAEEKPKEPEFIKDQPLPDLVEQYRLGDNIRDENGNIIYNSDVIKYLQSIFGDGSDGDIDINSDTNLITDAFYNNLTVKAGFTLYPSGYRIFVRNKLTIEATGKIARNGNNGGNGGNATVWNAGGGGSGGTALTSGSLYGALAGKNGGAGGDNANGTAGTAGSDLAKCLGSNGVAGGAGGAGGGFSGGGGGGAGSKTGTVYNYPRGLVPSYMLYDTLPAGDVIKSNPSAGSGGGGGGGYLGDYGAGGGGGGSAGGAGIIEIFAKSLVNNGTIEAKGGKGGNGGNAYSTGVWPSGGGGGAGGGNGGVIMLIYILKTGTGTTDVALGAKGTKGTGSGTTTNGFGYNGVDGTDGVAGKTFELKV